MSISSTTHRLEQADEVAARPRPAHPPARLRPVRAMSISPTTHRLEHR
ncbi:hypothetical protein AB0K60_36110 [Thermopolyspora sp. NPDC052614]